MQWREIGPATAGGRVAAVAGSATDPKLYYIGSAGGGVWKSANGTQTWDPVFDKQPVGAIGAVTIDPNNNDVVWVGTGESNPRNDVSYGDGVYKTTDGGDTWTNMGLKNSRFISRILVDPRNSNHVIVGALGDVFADSSDRGVYVTEDGGKTWKQTLYAGPMSGASDLAMDVRNPNVVYAGIWQFRRKPWTFQSGGDQDGLYKSTDGGETWQRIVGHGFPEGVTGRIGLAVAPTDGNRVYALVESKDGILWRSDDGGSNWTMISKDTLIDQRPFYFSHIAVDPKDENRVYAVSEALAVSKDGGKTFHEIAEGVHVDYHAIWIAPNDPQRIIVGMDGGYALTLDLQNWFSARNMPIGQIYHVGLSNENPYTVCVGLQDNNAWCGPSNSLDPSGILNKHWINTVGGDGEWSVPDPSDPNFIWSDAENGALQVYNKVTQDSWSAGPYNGLSLEGYDLSKARYRFNWDSPIAFAPWDSHTAWYGGNVVFQSTDRGIHWKVISPDLTLNDKAHEQPSGGPITHDVSGAEYTNTILDIEGSTLRRGEIWVGTDDGQVQLTRDGGAHWKNVTPSGTLPDGRFEIVAPSTLRAGTAFAALDRHYVGDHKPYLYVTHDFGATWNPIVTGLPADQYVRSVRPDIHNPNVVYAGTEQGVWISFDGGANWSAFQNGIAPSAVYDIRMQPQFNDLVIATHGRSAYIMDDMRPIQELQGAIASGSALFKPRDAYQYTLHGNDEGTYTDYAADNPANGTVVTFYQKAVQKGNPSIQILDSHGRVIRNVSGTHKIAGKDVAYVDNNVGINRYTWDWGVDGPVKWTGAAKERYQGPSEGPAVPPGAYSVRMTLGGRTYVQPFVVKPDPRSRFTQADYERTYEYSLHFMRQLSTVDQMLNSLDDVQKQLDAASAVATKKNDAAATAKIADATAARKALFDSLTADYHNDEDGIQRPGALREDVFGAYFQSQNLITPPIVEAGNRVDAEVAQGVERYRQYDARQLPAVNAILQSAGLKPVTMFKP